MEQEQVIENLDNFNNWDHQKRDEHTVFLNSVYQKLMTYLQVPVLVFSFDERGLLFRQNVPGHVQADVVAAPRGGRARGRARGRGRGRARGEVQDVPLQFQEVHVQDDVQVQFQDVAGNVQVVQGEDVQVQAVDAHRGRGRARGRARGRGRGRARGEVQDVPLQFQEVHVQDDVQVQFQDVAGNVQVVHVQVEDVQVQAADAHRGRGRARGRGRGRARGRGQGEAQDVPFQFQEIHVQDDVQVPVQDVAGYVQVVAYQVEDAHVQAIAAAPRARGRARGEIQRDAPAQQAQRDAPIRQAQLEVPFQQAEQEVPFQQAQRDAPVQQAQREVPFQQAEQAVPFQQAEQEVPFQQAQRDAPVQQAQREVPFQQAEQAVPFQQAQQEVPFQQAQRDAPVQQAQREVPFQQAEQAVPFQQAQQDGPLDIDNLKAQIELAKAEVFDKYSVFYPIALMLSCCTAILLKCPTEDFQLANKSPSLLERSDIGRLVNKLMLELFNIDFQGGVHSLDAQTIDILREIIRVSSHGYLRLSYGNSVLGLFEGESMPAYITRFSQLNVQLGDLEEAEMRS